MANPAPDCSWTSRADACIVPTISFKALQRARTTLEDFAKTYFLFHNLQLPEDFFKYLDVLVYVEGTIYQLDEANEDLCRVGADPSTELEGSGALLQVLEGLDLLDERVKYEIQQGFWYWEQERRLARCMLEHKQCLTGPSPGFTLEEALAVHGAKSFDYRVLNLLLFRLTHREVDEVMLKFLRVDEMLVDIGDDLVDYEDDVEANSFNIYRAFIHLYGKEAELKLVERISSLEEEHDRLLTQLPGELQRRYKERQKDAGQEPGSEKWSFPPPIYDEALFRLQVQEGN